MKETFYFPHDNNAHNDPKLMSVFMEVWLAWIWLYWILIELLHQQEDWKITKEQFDNYIQWYSMKENKWLALVEQLLSIYLTNDLFCLNDDWYIYSKRVHKNKEFRDDLSKKRSKAGKLWAEKRALNSQNQANAKQNSAFAKQGKERKGKEKKEKNNITQGSVSKHNSISANNIKQELEMLLNYWNGKFWKKYELTKDLQNAYTRIRKNYKTEQIEKAVHKYYHDRVQKWTNEERKQYELHILKFLTQKSNWFINYI